jgi:hypothetical protein
MGAKTPFFSQQSYIHIKSSVFIKFHFSKNFPLRGNSQIEK